MNIRPFQLERYFAQYEFEVPYLLSSSDCEPLSLNELLSMADGESMKRWNLLNLGYTESQGDPALRSEIARLYPSVTPENIMIITPEEGIFITLQTLLEKGDEIIVTFPGYQSLYEIATSIGCKVNYWQPKYDKAWSFETESLKQQITSKTKLLILNFPHNPTGATLSGNQYNEITELVKSNGITLFSDEMYRFLEHNSKDRLPSFIENYEKSIVLSGMSKSFGLAGLRIGWLITKNQSQMDQFQKLRDYITICSSAPSEILALMALRAKDQIIRRNLAIIHQNLNVLDQFFDKYYRIFEWQRPLAGPVAFPRLLLNQNIGDFCQDLIHQKGVMLLPSSVYELTTNHFRIGFGRKNLPEAVGQLENYVRENNF